MIKERCTSAAKPTPFINLRHARWLIGVLGMLISVVGKESLLGMILGQTRLEISTLVRSEEAQYDAPNEDWHATN